MLLVKTKLTRRVPAGGLIERGRLLELFDGDAPITLLSAPAGYGKSTLLLQAQPVLERRGYTTAWLALDEMDTDGGRLLMYVASALETAGVTLELPILAPDMPTLSDASLLALVVNAVESHRSAVALLLDDVHLLGPASMATLAILIERAPPKLRFILAARAVPELRLARNRATGMLCEIGLEELSFTRAETLSLLQAAGTDLDERDLERLDERIEGWVTGLRLFSLALRQGTPVNEAMRSLSGSHGHIADFFAQEVFAAQSDEVRHFLVRTSVLERISANLSEELTGVGGAALMLRDIERLRLFVVALDKERSSFRYHRLFAEFLRHKLHEEQGAMATTLYHQASEWCWSNGRCIDAIKHALRAGNMDRAANMLERRCHYMIQEGKLLLLLRLVQQIPQQTLRHYPRLLLTLAWFHTANLRLDESLALIATARRHIDEVRAEGSVSEQELQELDWLVLHRETIIEFACDRFEEMEARCQELVNTYAQLQAPYPYLITTTYAQLLFAARQQYQTSKHERLILMSKGVLSRSPRSPCTFASVSLQASIGLSLFYVGKTDAAIEILEQALEVSIRGHGIHSGVAAMTGLPLAQIFYEINQTERAAQLLQDTLHLTSEMEFVEVLIAGFMTSARICRMRGDLVGAERAMDQASAIAIERQLVRLQCTLLEERVRLLTQDGKIESAARCLIQEGIVGPAQQFMPRGEVNTQAELQAMAWVRVAQMEDRTWDAMLVARHWRNYCAARGALRSLVRWNIQLAKMLSVQGDVRAAKRALREAIAQAAPARIVRSFIDEGPTVRHLLRETYAEDRDVMSPTDMFAAQLVEAFEGSPSEGAPLRCSPPTTIPASSDGLNGRLTPKEHDILVLVSNGMSNREIAETVGMTEGSVKWYMQRVYDKVGTRRRLQAVERARKFGLIS